MFALSQPLAVIRGKTYKHHCHICKSLKHRGLQGSGIAATLQLSCRDEQPSPAAGLACRTERC